MIIFFTKRIGLVETVYRREQSTSPEEVLVQTVVINDFLACQSVIVRRPSLFPHNPRRIINISSAVVQTVPVVPNWSEMILTGVTIRKRHLPTCADLYIPFRRIYILLLRPLIPVFIVPFGHIGDIRVGILDHGVDRNGRTYRINPGFVISFS